MGVCYKKGRRPTFQEGAAMDSDDSQSRRSRDTYMVFVLFVLVGFPLFVFFRTYYTVKVDITDVDITNFALYGLFCWSGIFIADFYI